MSIEPGPSPSVSSAHLTTAYTELCRSYQGLHDFRMKLLSALPIASTIGLLALGKSLPSAPQASLQPEAVGYIGIFAGLFTLGLFAYEIRGLLMCHDYSITGAALEVIMNVKGQFTFCNESRPQQCYAGPVKRPLARLVNINVTSCFVYSLVFAAWFFVGLHYATGMHVVKCVYWAVALGVFLAIASSLSLHRLMTETKKLSAHGTTSPLPA